jgi:hypothetical protein
MQMDEVDRQEWQRLFATHGPHEDLGLTGLSGEVQRLEP